MRDRDVEDFVRRNTSEMLRLAYLLAGDNTCAEDLVQEVMLGELRNWVQTDSPAQHRSRVREQLVRVHLATRPEPSSRSRTLASDLVSFGADAGPEQVCSDWRVEPHQVFRELPVLQRTILVLMCYEQLDEEDVASLVDLAPARVRDLADQALRAMSAAVPATAELRRGHAMDTSGPAVSAGR